MPNLFGMHSTTRVLPIVESEITTLSFEYCEGEGIATSLEAVNFTRQNRWANSIFYCQNIIEITT